MQMTEFGVERDLDVEVVGGQDQLKQGLQLHLLSLLMSSCIEYSFCAFLYFDTYAVHKKHLACLPILLNVENNATTC